MQSWNNEANQVQAASFAPPSQSAPDSRPADNAGEPVRNPEVIVYSHSSLLYWWPVWVVGYLMAGITYWAGRSHEVGADQVWFYPSSNLGVMFFLTLFLVILITNISVRGLASALVIVSAILVTFVLAFFGLWDPILNWFGDLKIQMNLGAYFWFSTLMFVVWASTVFIFDRMSYWRVTPGQITHEFVFGAAAKSYDTENLVLEKYRDDVFRHWVLGLGSGDLHIQPYGANREEIEVLNVLFLGNKIQAIQHLIATQPEGFNRTVAAK